MLDNFLKTSIFNIANVDAKKIFDSIEEDEKDNPGDCRKRRKLDDFTPQERMIRRKLKNRVAAQTARDRKRERMSQLEEIVSKLESENKDLKKSNEEMKLNMKYLMEQNRELRQKMGMDSINEKGDHTYTQAEEGSVSQMNHVVIKKEDKSEKHAEEVTGTSCFFNHDVVVQSQADQLLDILERLEPGEISEIDASKEVSEQVEREITENLQVCGGATANESYADISSLSAEDTNELFAICEDIQDMVEQPLDTIENSNDNIFSTFSDMFYSAPIKDSKGSESPEPFEEMFFTDSDFPVKSQNNYDSLFCDLFPTLL